MKTVKLNQSVEKTVRIIEVMAASNGPLRLQDIAAAVNIPPSTTLRMVNTMIDMGYAYQEKAPMRRYGLTLRFTKIGQMVRDHFPYYDLMHPYVQSLAAQTGETCCVATLQNHRVQYFDVVVGRMSALTIRQQIGGTAYLHCTASGKMFLIQYTRDQMEELMQQVGLPALTPRTITSLDDLGRELERCREMGYALDDEEVESGMRCLAAPIYDATGRVVVTMSMSGPVARMPIERCEQELVPLVREAAKAITGMISGQP